MMEAVTDAKQFSAGLIATALACPLGAPDAQRMIGPVFVLAHALPFEVGPGELAPDFDVRPHPHIGVATLTYLLSGHSTHRDSLGSRWEGTGGSVHYMVAGRGVVHSERFERLRALGGRLELLQIILALPDGSEDLEPSFTRVDPGEVPEEQGDGVVIRRLAGAGTTLPYPRQMFLHDVHLDPGARYALPVEMPERAVYVLAGEVETSGTRARAQQTATFADGPAHVTAVSPTRLLGFGGEPVGPRYAWWNFAHSSLARIAEAKAEWRAGRTPLPPGDTESFTPAPPDDGRPLMRLNGAPPAPWPAAP